ncbi:MAG: hypothetical protein H0V17_26430 [Deltaproteobacteria bacterium]|nr:hypothetical protein [Deltaproteobacteria bacterium]
MRDQGEPAKTRHDGSDVDLVLPVLDESRSRIRIAFEDDDARMALWIPREDTWPAIAVPIELSDRDGAVRSDAGVWALRGAPVELGEHVNGRRAVRIRDELLILRGYVADALISNVWIAGKGDRAASFTASHWERWLPPLDPRTRVKFSIETKIRAAPDPKAPVIAAIESGELIGVISKNLGDHRQIEIVRPHARVRGYVFASEVSHTTEDLRTTGTGSGHGFGMSHADRIEVPPGTCLFERIDGEVVGVQLAQSTRLGRKGGAASKWSEINIGTSWTIAKVYIRDQGDDPTQPQWEQCMQPAHR